MADQWCNPPATLTEFATTTVTTESVSTSTSLSPSPFASTSTTVITSCAATTVSGACISSSVVTQTAIIDGITQVEVPIVITVPVTQVQVQPTRTLFSPCPSNPGSGSSSSRDDRPSETPDSPTPSPSSSTRYSIYTPEPVVSTSVSSFTDTDGSVRSTQVMVTTTLPPSSVIITATSGNPQHSGGAGGGGGSASAKSNAGAIAGGVIGGFLGLLALAALIWFIMRRRQAGRWDDIFEKDEEPAGPAAVANVGRDRHSRIDLDIATEPAPYQYGLVGTRSRSPSPPTSPTTHHTSFSLSAPPGHQGPYVPELYGIAPAHTGTTSYSTFGSAHSRPTTSSSSRPSTANSQMPLNTRPSTANSVNARRRSRGDDIVNVPAIPGPPSAAQVPAGYPPQAQHPPLIMTASGTSYGPPPAPAAVGYPPAQSPPLMSSPPQSPSRPLQPPLVPVNADPGTSTSVLPPRKREKTPAVAGPSRPVVVHTDGGRVDDQRVQSPPAAAQAEFSRPRRKGSGSAPAPAPADPPPPAYTD